MDDCGHSGLQKAVQCHNQDMVAFLLQQPRVRLRDAQLHAVAEGQIDILRKLIHWQTKCVLDISKTDFKDYIKHENYDLISVLTNGNI